MGMKIKNECYDDIVDKYNSGLNSVEIAKLYSVKYGAIINVLKKCNVKIGGHYQKISNTQYSDIVRRYLGGDKITDIANDYNVVRSTVEKILRKERVDFRNIGDDNRKYEIDHEYFDIIDNKEKAYFLGLLFADGCNDEKYYVSIGLQSEDEYILQRLINSVYKNDKPELLHDYRSKYNSNKKDISRFVICSSKICSSLLKQGMMARKSLILKYPSKLDKKLFPHFLRGYFDGDGSVWESKSRIRISSSGRKSCSRPSLSFSLIGTYNMLNNIKTRIESHTGYKIKSRIRKNANIYTWTVSKQSTVEDIYHLLYDDAEIFFHRKRNKFEVYFC